MKRAFKLNKHFSSFLKKGFQLPKVVSDLRVRLQVQKELFSDGVDLCY